MTRDPRQAPPPSTGRPAGPPRPGPHRGAQPPRDAAAHGPYDALVVAGGGARRLGGADKPGLTVGGRTLLDRVLGACPDAVTTVVVGPRRPTSRPVRWTREQPRGGGPLPALEAGLRALGEQPGTGPGTDSGTVLVLSADLPFLRGETVRALLRAVREDPAADGTAAGDGDTPVEGAVLHDGRDQPLAAAYRTEPLRRELALLRTEHGGLTGMPLRLLLPDLRLRRVPVPAGAADTLDCDTWEDLAAARRRIREHGTVLDEWMAAAQAELGIELDVDTTALLDLARDAAHGVARPAAPLTTFLVGYAAAQRGGTPEDVAEAVRAATRLAERWSAETDPL